MEEVLAEAVHLSHGRILAALIRTCGNFELAEDALQDAMVQACETWTEASLPEQPGAWLHTVASRKLIDHMRSAGTRDRKRIPWTEDEVQGAQTDATPSEDDTLRLIFTCCHPALDPDAQVALALNALCGLTAAEIAAAYLVKPATMAQRLVRTKAKIQSAGIPFRVPPSALMHTRLAAVLEVFYLVFNAGYSAPSGEQLINEPLCEEGIHLARLLCDAMPAEPEARGLLALMLLQHSRRFSRQGPDGELVLLEQQDRAKWDKPMVDEGRELLLGALAMARSGPYQLQAAIACVHADAATADATDWLQILYLYDRLVELHPTPVVALNRAVALSMAKGPELGLRAVEAIAREAHLANYLYLHATRADLLARLGRKPEAAAAYRQAIALAGNQREVTFLRGKLGELEGA